ncbi:PQQ-dependent sugar dehydrogenase [Rhodohalobacter sp. SW132]|uniref:PQQ-dependent sugar dehydrogenase n=1 Tax=Rhodohalobacter sp. SW132 TaxID=2293433 RepID=UPI0018F3CA5E|nr:PQQ-dependent sugar dehydrogenase [Rhodohalobacter sp. SW132]
MRKILRTFVGSVIIVLSAITLSEAQLVVEEVIEESVSSEKTDFRIVKVVEGLEHPWAVNWLSDGRMIITERPGRLLIVDGNSITPLTGLPEIDTDEDQKTAPEGGNQGGLLDVVPHPEHAENGWVYFTYSSPGDDDSNFGDEDYATGTALARAKINSDGTALEDLEELYTQVPRTEPGRHYGSRIVFPGDGTVIFSIGDRGIRYPSQDLTDPGGAMIRLNEDGGAADDNPFVEMEPGNLRPEIYSFGHRNNQGLAIDPDNGNIWTTEHGPYGGDLVHIVVEGRNYGWPQVTQGVEYDTKAMIGIGKSAPGVEEPKHIWEESMAPSGLAFYHQGEIEEWNGSLFAGSLLKEQLHRLEIDGEEVVHDEVLITEVIGRIRDVRMGPDGNLYLVTDESDGGVYRIEAQ